MQLFNKSSAKKIFAHTWYLYPVGAAILSVIWIWAFPTYHQPTKHQTISIFFAAEIKNDSFLKYIQSNYEKEKLREVTPSYCLPSTTVFGQKMKIANNYSDILVLNETTLAKFDSQDNELFVEHLEKLLNCEPIEKPSYNFAIHNRNKETTLIKPKKIIITEGILVLENEKIRDLADIKIYVESDDDILIKLS